MRILTVRQPWAWAIIHGGKDVENRVRNIAGKYRGPIAIHAGLAPVNDKDIPSQLRQVLDAEAEKNGAEKWAGGYMWDVGTPDPRPWLKDRGKIIGIVDLVDAHEPDACSPWAMDGHWHLCLSNPRPLTEPIPYKGALGLRQLPDHIIQLAQERSQK